MMVLQAEVETLKEQMALQKQQLEATQEELEVTQQQLVEKERQSKEIATAAALAQVEAEKKAAAAAREHAANIKALRQQVKRRSKHWLMQTQIALPACRLD